MPKSTGYVIDEYRIINDENIEIKAHVHASFDGVRRRVDFAGTGPLEHFLQSALKQAKLDLATKVKQQAGVKGPERTWKHDAREKYNRLWVLAEKNGVDFLNPVPSDPVGKLHSDLQDFRNLQAKYPEANLQPTIERLEKEIRMLQQ